MTVQKARQTIKKALIKDEDLMICYVSNIAMLLSDRYGITDFDERNDAAKEILNLLFDLNT